MDSNNIRNFKLDRDRRNYEYTSATNYREVKCFTTELISSKNLENFFTINISEQQIEQLKILEKVYKEMLVKYQEYTKLSQNEINMLVEGYKKRIEKFEKLNKRT